MWRQPLEIVVSPADISHPDPVEEFFVPLLALAWYWRATTIRKQGNWAIQICRGHLDNAFYIRGERTWIQVFSKFDEEVGSDLRYYDFLWMAVKITSAVFVEWTTKRLEQFLDTKLDAHRRSILDDQEQGTLLDVIKDFTVPMLWNIYVSFVSFMYHF